MPRSILSDLDFLTSHQVGNRLHGGLTKVERMGIRLVLTLERVKNGASGVINHLETVGSEGLANFKLGHNQFLSNYNTTIPETAEIASP